MIMYCIYIRFLMIVYDNSLHLRYNFHVALLLDHCRVEPF